MPRHTRLAPTLLVLLAACVPAARPPQSRPAPAPVAPVPPRPAPTLAADWRDWPVTPGTWRYAAEPGGTSAIFGSGLARLRCDPARREIVLFTGSAGPLTVRTSSVTRTLASGPESRIAATDPLLDAIAFSRGRFALEQPGRAPLVLPAWAEVARVIEDCRP